MSEEGRNKDQGIAADLLAEFEGFEHRQKESFNDFMLQDSRRRAAHHNLSKLLEIKGYEVFRVDTAFQFKDPNAAGQRAVLAGRMPPKYLPVLRIRKLSGLSLWPSSVS